MCGIAGVIARQGGVDARQLQAMLAQLAHRGPDGDGLFIEGNVGIGHRRLAIIDLAGGAQPMVNADRSICVSYNGEIYNYRTLRADLEAMGCVFRTSSDTEVLLQAYERWGEDCVSRFRGMFAFAVLDLRARRLFLARDHFGIKPLYYGRSRTAFAFSSELYPLRAALGGELSVDLEAVDQYLRLQYIPAPKTIYREVQKLPPAHRLSVSLEGEILKLERYWQPQFMPDRTRTRADWVHDLDRTLRESVQAHLVSDVPFGAFLSGGMDSSIVVAYMAQLLGTPVRTFTMGFAEAAYDERMFARQVAAHCRTEHHEEVVDPFGLEMLPGLVHHYGEPFGDSSAIPTYQVARLARTAVPMVLSGDGGDELFAGYATHHAWLDSQERECSQGGPSVAATLRRLLRRARDGGVPPPSGLDPRLERWLGFVTFFPAQVRFRLWRRDLRGTAMGGQLQAFEQAFTQAAPLADVQFAQLLDLSTYLPNDILTKVDVASMMHGLEVRTPLIDREVFELVARIPPDLNIMPDTGGGTTGKALLRTLLARYYPPGLFDRRKAGFAVPLERLFDRARQQGEDPRARLTSPRSRLRELFEPKFLARLVGSGPAAYVWLLLVLDEWLVQDATGVVHQSSRR